jgi:hypothetical protein
LKEAAAVEKAASAMPSEALEGGEEPAEVSPKAGAAQPELGESESVSEVSGEAEADKAEKKAAAAVEKAASAVGDAPAEQDNDDAEALATQDDEPATNDDAPPQMDDSAKEDVEPAAPKNAATDTDLGEAQDAGEAKPKKSSKASKKKDSKKDSHKSKADDKAQSTANAADKAVEEAAKMLGEEDSKKSKKSEKTAAKAGDDDDLGDSQGAPHKGKTPSLGESATAPKKAAAKKGSAKKKAAPAPKAAGKAYIPLNPTVPKMTVDDVATVKGLLNVASPTRRQFQVNSYADVSATQAGAAMFGGNMHVLNAKTKDEFRFSNTHGQIGGMGFATHYPHYNKASVISSGTKKSKNNESFKPKTVATFTHQGNVGVGVTGPASRLHVQGDGNTRLLNVNHWGDLSACATGIGLMAGNAYVTTEANQAKFRFSNSHSGIGAIGFAVNYPDWNKASIVTSGTKAAQGKKAFKPVSVATFTHDGLAGIGTTRPKSRLDIKSKTRQLSVNDWIDISSQGTAGFIGLNAHMILRGTKRFFSFSNTAKNMGAIGLATNYPLINQMSIVASSEGASKKGTLFKPTTVATFTRTGNVGFGTDAPKAKLDVRHGTKRQISANKYADVSANEQLQGFFGGNGYAVGRQFAFSNTHGVVGAVGLATHYPSPGHASIISSANQQPKADASFKPKILAQFKFDGSMEIPKNMVIKGDLRVTGRMLNGDDTKMEYDFMAAHEALVRENALMRERLTKMEAMMATMMSK